MHDETLPPEGEEHDGGAHEEDPGEPAPHADMFRFVIPLGPNDGKGVWRTLTSLGVIPSTPTGPAKRQPDEPLVRPDVAEYLQQWFDKEVPSAPDA